MLPSPALSFTIPSIHDDTVLCCRIYHPTCLAPNALSEAIGFSRKKAAIVAHPYAPLGGCFDDPVVDLVASMMLNQGFIVGTFNFRGAGTSKGRTSWQSKAEQNDYISFIAFMVYYMHGLSIPPAAALDLDQHGHACSDSDLHDLTPIPSQALPPPRQYDPRLVVTGTDSQHPRNGRSHIPSSQPLLLLSGYSYGALITTSLPPIISSMILPFQKPLAGSAHAEIRLRARGLAVQQNEMIQTHISLLLESQSNRRRRSLQLDDYVLSHAKVRKSNGGVRIGGEEDLRRPSYESTRSRSSFSIDAPEKVRKGINRVRSIAKSHRLSPNKDRSPRRLDSSDKDGGLEPETSHGRTTQDVALGNEEIYEATIKEVPGITDSLQTAYLLVSPLQGLVNSLATMWSSRIPFMRGKEKDSIAEHEMKFTVDRTLAVFGDDDVFVSARRLRAWAERLTDAGKKESLCQFSHVEVPGAGHFWHDHEAVKVLRDEVNRFVASL